MAQRIDVNTVRHKLGRQDGALLVCAYDDEQKCRDAGVSGAITFKQLQARLDGLPKNQEIVFFCA
jgi:hypothetical protein